MKEIPLTQNKVALVDDEDFEALNQFNWYAAQRDTRWYAMRNGPKVKRKRLYMVMMHREIVNAPCGVDVDHWNRDGLDNRRKNLRLCSRTENLRNKRRRYDSKSPYKGICYRVPNQSWQVRIRRDREEIHIGYFPDPISAAVAYDVAAILLFGEFACLNFPGCYA
jgi:hypothetical protein